MKWRRLLLKISGERLAGDGGGIDADRLRSLAGELAGLASAGHRLAVVTGGGNFIRGSSLRSLPVRTPYAHYMGMMTTNLNALALAECLSGEHGLNARAISGLPVPGVIEGWDFGRTSALLEAGGIPVLGGGTGNPFFTTDTAAALRAIELGMQVLVKGTKVDGVYTADPVRDPAARRIPAIGYDEYLSRGLKVIDATAVALCRETGLPVAILDAMRPGALGRFAGAGEGGSLIGGEGLDTRGQCV